MARTKSSGSKSDSSANLGFVADVGKEHADIDAIVAEIEGEEVGA